MNDLSVASEASIDEGHSFRELIHALLKSGTSKHVKKNHVIWQDVDQIECLIYVRSGLLREYFEDDRKGRDKFMFTRNVNVGEFCGLRDLFSEEPFNGLLVSAVEASEILVIPYNTVQRFIASEPRLAILFAQMIASELSSAHKQIRDLAFCDVRARMIEVLKMLAHQPQAKPHSDGKVISMTRQDIAKYAKCSREMVGRVLKSLQKQGCVNARGKTIVIRDILWQLNH